MHLSWSDSAAGTRRGPVTTRPELGRSALRALALIRLVNGFLGLFLPGFLLRRVAPETSGTAAFYPFRMFGIRTVVLGADLLLLKGSALDRARVEAVLIHTTDTACAAVGGIRGDLPRKGAQMTVAISAVNAVLAVIAWRFSPRVDDASSIR